jgi:hypothetical protein
MGPIGKLRRLFSSDEQGFVRALARILALVCIAIFLYHLFKCYYLLR